MRKKPSTRSPNNYPKSYLAKVNPSAQNIAMNAEESISHLERSISRLEKHVENQDAEMYQMAKQLETIKKEIARLNGDIQEVTNTASPSPDRDPESEKPPHY